MFWWRERRERRTRRRRRVSVCEAREKERKKKEKQESVNLWLKKGSKNSKQKKSEKKKFDVIFVKFGDMSTVFKANDVYLVKAIKDPEEKQNHPR